MARIFITGSSDGLGLMTAKRLISAGHKVTLHARSQQRAKESLNAAPGAAECLVADLSSLAGVRELAASANKTGRFDAILYNAGVGFQESFHLNEDEVSHVFAINVVAPYVLTCLLEKPDRLVYMSSGLHSDGKVPASMNDITWTSRGKSGWNGLQAYSDSKQLDTILAFAVARLWPQVVSNALAPGWVATKMGGAGAPHDINKSIDLMVNALLEDKKTLGTGGFLFANGEKLHALADSVEAQDALLKELARISNVTIPT